MITKINRDTGETFIDVRAEPLAQLDTSREVLLVWTQNHEKAMPETEQPVEKPDKEAVEKPVEEPDKEAIEKPAEEPDKEAVEEPVDAVE